MKTRKIAQLGLLIALQVVLTRFLSINTPIVRIGLGFIPIVIVAILHGPWAAGVCAAIGDLLGAVLFPTGSGAYFPGFTFSIAITGIIFGLWLYKKQPDIKRIIFAVVLSSLVVSLGLNSLWLWILQGNAFFAALPQRFIQVGIMLPIQVTVIFFVQKLLPKLNLN